MPTGDNHLTVADVKRRIKILPKQDAFIRSSAKESLYCGGFGSGKTRALCYYVATHAAIPGNLVGLCRKTRAALTKTTLRTLLMPEGNLPPVLPPGTYDHQISKSTIKLYGGGEIMYFGFDDESSVASMNLGAVGVDEAVELNEDEYTMLLGRIRLNSDPHRGIACSTNPGNPSHFLYNRFYRDNPAIGKRRDANGNLQLVRQRNLIVTTSYDNVFLPADYLEMLNSLTGARRQRYVEGLWVGFEGLVYGDQWNRDLHVKHRDEKWVAHLFGVDEGYTNPAVLLDYGIDSDGRMHLIRMIYARRMLQDDFISKCIAWDEGAGWPFVCDPSAAGLIGSLQKAGIHAVAANNDVATGIAMVQNRLMARGDGRPRITYEPDCSDMILEKESYAWNEKKDQPIKEMDHAQDAERYAVVYRDENTFNAGVGGSEPKDETAEEKAIREAKRGADYEAHEVLENDALWNGSQN